MDDSLTRNRRQQSLRFFMSRRFLFLIEVDSTLLTMTWLTGTHRTGKRTTKSSVEGDALTFELHLRTYLLTRNSLGGIVREEFSITDPPGYWFCRWRNFRPCDPWETLIMTCSETIMNVGRSRGWRRNSKSFRKAPPLAEHDLLIKSIPRVIKNHRFV